MKQQLEKKDKISYFHLVMHIKIILAILKEKYITLQQRYKKK